MHTLPLLQSPSMEHSCEETGQPPAVSCEHEPNGQSEDLRHVGSPDGAGVAPGQTLGMPESGSPFEPAAPPVTGRIPPVPPTLPAPPAAAFPEPPAPARATPPAPPEDLDAAVLLPPQATAALARVASIH